MSSTFRSGYDLTWAWPSGLTLEFALDVNNYISQLTETTGLVVVLHDQNHVAFPEEEGIMVAPGMETRVGVTRVVTLYKYVIHIIVQSNTVVHYTRQWSEWVTTLPGCFSLRWTALVTPTTRAGTATREEIATSTHWSNPTATPTRFANTVTIDC